MNCDFKTQQPWHLSLAGFGESQELRCEAENHAWAQIKETFIAYVMLVSLTQLVLCRVSISVVSCFTQCTANNNNNKTANENSHKKR